MKPIELVITPSGDIRSVYDDSRLELFGQLKGKMSVKRASIVEWEELNEDSGWTVRAFHDPDLAIRLVVENGAYRQEVRHEGTLAVFTTREAALESEMRFFWDLLPEEKT